MLCIGRAPAGIHDPEQWLKRGLREEGVLERYCYRRPRGRGGVSKLTWNRILMKILEEEVVSSWVRRMLSMTCQLMASCSSSAAKNLATLRSLLVSRRWISEYCRRKHSSKHSWYAGNFSAKRVASNAWYLKVQPPFSRNRAMFEPTGEAHACCSPNPGPERHLGHWSAGTAVLRLPWTHPGIGQHRWARRRQADAGAHFEKVFSWLQHSRIMEATSNSSPGASSIFMSLCPVSSNVSPLMMVR